jgi:hypothetical protein
MKVYLPKLSMVITLMLVALIAINTYAVKKEKSPEDAGKGEYVVGTGTFAASDAPVYLWYGYSYTQTIYLQTELDFSGQMIEQIGYQYAGTTANFEVEIEVWLEHTSESTITSTVQLNNSTKVYDGPWNLSAGDDWSMITIDPFVYNNTDNLLLTIIEKKPGWNSSGDKFYAESILGLDLSVGNQNDGSPYDPNALPSSFTRFYRANTKFVTSTVPAGPAFSQITPTTLDFGQTGIGIGKTLSVQIKNTGSDPLEITGATSSNSQFAVVNTSFPFTLGAAGNQNVEIEFVPTTETSETGTIEFLFDAGIAGDREVQVSGQGIEISDITIGTGTFQSSNTPVYPYYGYSFTQTIYLQSELNFQDKQIYQIGYQYLGSNSNLELNVEVWIAHTAATQITSSVPLNTFTKVYDGPWFLSAGEDFSVIEIMPFVYNNTDNLIITVIEKKPGWDSPSDLFRATQTPGQNLCIGAWNDGSAYDPNNLPSGQTIGHRANTKLWFEDIATGPAISEITPTTLDFGELDFGQTKVMPVVIKNAGVDPLVIDGYNSSNPHFSIPDVTFPISLGYNQQQEMDVLFQPTTTDAETGTITFVMDPLIDGDKEVSVSGQMAELTITEFPWFEGFDAGLPEGWQNQMINGMQWEFFTVPFEHTVIYNFPGSPQVTANLVTPLIDLSGMGQVRFGINHMFYYYQSSLPIAADIMISTDGSTWTVLEDMSLLIDNYDYNYDEFDLSAYAGQQVYLAFAVDLPDNNTDFYEVVWEIEHVTIYEFIPTYNVSFTVEDPDGIALTEAIVTLDGNTNAPGVYLFEDIPAGTYDYTVEHPGFVKAFGQVTVVDQDVVVNAVLSLPGMITQFPWTEGFETGALPEGWDNQLVQGPSGWQFFLSPLFSITYMVAQQGNGPVEAYMVSPMLVLTGHSAVTLSINHMMFSETAPIGDPLTETIAEIQVSNDGGSTWHVVDSFTGGEGTPGVYDDYEYDITALAANQPNVYIRFAFNVPAFDFYYLGVWEVEEITVSTEAEETYAVAFNVEDDMGNPLTDAIITLDGVTNAAGDYFFEDILPGVYEYSVELAGYLTATGQVTVVDEDVTEAVVLNQPVIITEFPWFEGFDGGALPEGWQNVVNEGNGFGFFMGPYPHTAIWYFGDQQRNAQLITPLLDISGLESAILGVTHRIYAWGTGWSHKILKSTDGENWEIIAEFTEGFDPDINMYMEFDLDVAKSGAPIYIAFEADYPMHPDYYEVVWEIVDVTVFEPVELFNVTFNVEEDMGNPLADAIITLDGMTNAAGDYLFEEIEPGIYDYSVELEGYITAEGQVEVVDEDAEVTVFLEKIGQLVELTEGWSLISSYQNPENNALEAVFADQILSGNLIIMLNQEGFFWPAQNINTLGDWNPYNGYKVKMNETDVVNILGEMVEDRTVALTQGINYLPVLSEVPVDASVIFDQIDEGLIYAFDLVNTLIYWPQGGINSLLTLNPGVAYIVGLTAAATVTYPESPAKAAVASSPIAVENSPWIVQKTGSTHIVSISMSALSEGFQQGDIIAAFNTAGQCVGMVQQHGAGNLGLVVYGDDFTSENIDGMTHGEPIYFKMFSAATGEIIDLEAEWDASMPNSGYFTENGLSAVKSFKYETFTDGSFGARRVNIYPNPASGEVFVNLDGIEQAVVQIIDQIGQIKMDTFIQQESSRLDISNLRPGVYFVRITNDNQVVSTSKLIVR